MQTNLMPSFTLRSRRETNPEEVINSRLVNYWENDSPQITAGTRPQSSFKDTNPTSSRLYRTDLNRAQPYVTPAESVEKVKREGQLRYDMAQTLNTLQKLKIQTKTPAIELQIKEQAILYNALAIKAKSLNDDALAANPYFDKYDIASDSRNVIRELRGAVSEEIVDRGLIESQKLLKREFESRWVEASVDSISAFELLRPKFNNMETVYNK